MARYSSMSPRHFGRLFRAEIGVNPARAVERLRLEAACKRRNSA
jgi:transcriptional regulator GlxA family with amidase domain